MMRNLRNIGNRMRISIPTDDNGLTSRECPNPECRGVFKLKFGTGLKGENLPCHCPYCGFTEDPSNFNTSEQIEYAKSVAMRQITQALEKDLKKWGNQLERSTRNSFIKMKVDFKGSPHPIRYYQEKQIETQVTCEICTLEYAIFGVFSFCPDCGTHNSIQILKKNLELVEKEVAFAGTSEDAELSKRLIEDALENAVSSFDGFGRATTGAYSSKAADVEQAKEISFQNLEGARKKVQSLFGFDIADTVETDDLQFVVRCFQKRHLLAHTMGVIDKDYVKKAHDPRAIVGRKITIVPDEVIKLAGILKTIGEKIVDNLKS
ncbi:MAG: hypothetical protein KJZ77_00165 [Anaerolineales bacterium]|nr:hypothetical protein [Anaerolineales bacterium]